MHSLKHSLAAESQMRAHACCDLQAARPRAIVDLIRSAEQFRIPGGSSSSSTGGKAVALPQPGNCQRCGYISSQVGGGGGPVGRFASVLGWCVPAW